MDAFHEQTITAQRVRSLCWLGDTLIDWAGGGARYTLDGRTIARAVTYAYRFDAAVVSPSGEFAVIYERLGTKGLVLERGQIVREINRSFYHAHVYDYPVALLRLPDGREAIAHCPEHYNQIEIEDVHTGEALTRSSGRRPADIFHSRLLVNTAGTRLLSAGWVWHPWDVVAVYDIAVGLADPSHLDEFGLMPRSGAEVSGATFLDDDTLLLVTSEETDGGDDEDDDDDALWKAGPRACVAYDLRTHTAQMLGRAAETVGTCMPLGRTHIVSFYEHPKVIELATGAVVQRWPDLHTGTQRSSIAMGAKGQPPIALDAARQRFAVATDDAIHIITAQGAEPDDAPTTP